MTADLSVRLRDLAPRVLTVLVRRYGDFDTCEDAVQEALFAAARAWPVDGAPANPLGWLIRVAGRRRIELWHAESARQRRELTAALLEPPPPDPDPATDDTLTLFLLCCHPALSDASASALTLRAVGGLSSGEIARAFLSARQPRTWVKRRTSLAGQLALRGGAGSP